ncbi:GL23190 [Drosophila persimilis]|uniref:V-type proton ATPase subunit a n=1 Tax=Drosophila persimilis TaxID=7234 RepID=B4G5D6_DROPE|nr:GL23190 [Drosophila persimilis]
MPEWWSFGSQETDSIFRSEKMCLVQIFLQPEAAYDIISVLGEVGCVRFRDINGSVPVQQKKFIAEVRRCDELERKIRYVTVELEKDGHKAIDLIEDLPWESVPAAYDLWHNFVHFKNYSDILLQFVPQVLFLMFGYMCFMIF